MHVQSPAAMRSSADLERMDALLKATGISTPITVSSFPPVQLDVEACYNQLSRSQNQRPEDIVMRQALELYCSLISPPTTPTEVSKSGYQSEQDHLPITPSGIFHCDDEYRPSSLVFDAAKACDYDPATDPNRPFGFASGQNYLPQHNYKPHQTHLTQYSWSTPSTVSDHSDTDDMDDPFACYPSSHPLRLTQHSGYTPQVNPAPRRQSCEPTLQKGSHSYASRDRIQISAQHPMNSLGGSLGMAKASSADVRSPGTIAQSLARRSFFSSTVEPSAPEPKRPAGRKRSFSVVSLVKQRKGTSTNAGSLRISGPMPINTSHSASSSGTFSIPVRPSRSSGARLSTAGSLSPALEVNEDITPVKPNPHKPRTRTRSGTLPQEEELNPMNISRKYSTRPETKSLWKTLKTSTSRASLSVDRPVIHHVNH
ncbi:hypothetical protein PTTG_05414 [Puccinia triticina 1-1 BBBD Race 1]|uniref:Uncharacterized protein n=2 Tax=Puccinia triticina TaxID=208348 RepID=A0A180GQV3_PUCT1|nr:uncharacterized protein PtA15_7A400 [Puccinia triticina]OAV94769.1 hypothetical protein PTTG_05414 [Puccinia triticina 1-1 BBBD Race 1]WAQ86672.1 hypothetical protein PtA15_7A400 [Puccinia triticina]WAR56538.1 hypothetical protein PtB15_7B387 [Puccinia triticina]